MQHTDELIKVKDLSCIDLDIEDRAQAGGMITHEAHNKTKGGQFAVSVRMSRFPLPLIPVVGETTQDIAIQCALMTDFLGDTSNKPISEIYQFTQLILLNTTKDGQIVRLICTT